MVLDLVLGLGLGSGLGLNCTTEMSVSALLNPTGTGSPYLFAWDYCLALIQAQFNINGSALRDFCPNQTRSQLTAVLQMSSFPILPFRCVASIDQLSFHCQGMLREQLLVESFLPNLPSSHPHPLVLYFLNEILLAYYAL